MKTRLFFALGVALLAHAALNAQVKIGDNATAINSASLLELETTDKGFVLPRVSITSVSASAPLASGLLTGTVVYNTNSSTTGGSGIGIYYWDGSKWNYLANTTITGNYWSITGNSGTNPSSNFIGTTDAKDFVAKTNNTERLRILGAASGSSQAGWIGMGVALPKSALDVAGNYAGKNVFTIQNTSSTGFSSVDMLDNSGNLAGTFGFANSGTGGIFGGHDYFNIYGNDFVFTNNSGTYAFYVKGSNGYIGLNTNTPSERLHVVGNIYLNGAFMPGGNAGTSGYVLTSAGANTSPVWSDMNSLAWSLTGNSGTSSATNFLGTTDNHAVKFKVNNTLAGYLDSSGGSGNTLYGYASGLALTTGLHNTAVGTQALNAATSANNNSAYGYQSLFKNTTGTGNTAAGYTSMYSNTTGQYNTALGLAALYSNTTGNYNVAIGQSALQNNISGNNNAVVGEDGLLSNTTGNYLAGLGTNALHDNTSGSSNTAVGESTLYKNTTGNYNTALGGYSLFNNTTASNNISIGYYAGNATTTGGNNVFIGSQSGNSNTTGSNNTLVGTNTALQSVGLTNAAAIGYNAKVALNNSLVLGDTTTGGYAVNVGIGVRNPLKRLHIDAAPVGTSAASDSLKIDHLASSNSAYNKAVMVIDSATGYVSRQSINTLGANNYWSLTGNGGTSYANNFLGTTDNTSLRFRTNNTEQMILDSLGTLSIGSYGPSSFNTDNPPKLSVDYDVTSSNTIAYLRGSINSYFQMNLRNKSNGTNASTDYVATADNGTDSTYYVDLGINSSTYSPGVDNWGGQNDAYLYSSSRNLLIGTQSSNSDILFLAGGGRTKYNTMLRIDGSTGNIIVGTGNNQANATGNIIRGPNGGTGTNIPGGSLTLQGGSSNGNTSGGALNLFGGGTVSGTYGAVNINTSTNSATNINTGSSAANVTIGGAANNILLPKFATVGGMYYTSLNTGQVSTTGANMTWDSINNRLGIGITNPGYKLSVLSAANPLYLSGVQVTSTFSSDSILTINAGVVKKTPVSSVSGSFWNLAGNSGTNASSNFIGTTDAVDFVAKTNNTERMRITSSGNVGIGTNNPQQSLSINSGLNIDQGSGNTGSTVNALTFGSGSGEGIGSKRSSGGNQYGLDFYTAYNNRMSITNSGNVGIGITSPSYRLSVLSSSDPLYLSGVQATSTFSSDSILTIYNGIVKKAPYSSLPSGGSSGWSLTGNSGTNTTSNFIGTTDNNGLIFKVNNTVAGYLGNSSSQSTTFGYNTSGTSTGQFGTAIGSTAQATSQYAAAFAYGSTASGQYSTALGYNAYASSQYANAVGSGASATSQYATALGYNSSANSSASLALGYNASAGNQDAIAAGNGSSASSSQTVAIGRQSTASGYQGIAIGYNASATSGSTTLAIGVSSAASGYQATAIGYSTTASNSQAMALGNNATASGYQSTAVGNNASATGSNSTAIGNGASTSQTNALILGNTSANVGIGTSTPNTSTSLDVSGYYKLGSNGTVTKNSISTSATLSSTTVSNQYSYTYVSGYGNIVLQNSNTNYTDVTFTLPNAASNTKASVSVSPSSDLPDDIVIAFARLTSTTTVKVRFMNLGTQSRTVSGTFYITVTDF